MTLKEQLFSEKSDLVFEGLYGKKISQISKERYLNLIANFEERFNNLEGASFFSSPGRSEIIGNHTDHNLGKVVGASINMDCVALARKTNDDMVVIKSLSFDQDFSIDINNLAPKRHLGSIDLVKGILNGFKKNNHQIGGLEIVLDSNVVPAAGVSSSASFEMLLTMIINYFYNDNKISVFDLAKIGQYAENVYWKKGSGLLDQMACAYGGLITIDFGDPNNLEVSKLKLDTLTNDYDLLIVPTGKSHADLNQEYSAMPLEMKAVASFFGKEVLRGLEVEDILKNLNTLREKYGDRAILRSIHFVEENKRVDELLNALEEKDTKKAISVINRSGNSSYKYLQNCVNNNLVTEQGIPLYLMMSDLFIEKIGDGASRVHGGGFAGVILVVLPKNHTDEFKTYLRTYQKDVEIYDITIREYGAVNVSDLLC